MCVSILLDYPGDDALQRYEAVEEELSHLPQPVAEPISKFISWARQIGLRSLREHFVETFDQRRRCALWLSYYAVGDTRQRGHAILSFSQVMADAGWQMDREELADYLPAVLEFAARDESGRGEELLASHRDGLEVLRSALVSYDSGYQNLLTAVCRTLPDVDLEVIERYQNLVRQGPATELVGMFPTLKVQ
ncbi:MAG: nitrate reductase molybdenum cofactor assembly chaperone [Actinomycetaceae bacterium]|nr:nitrate reductase molybdenum cofactor assembly chaperone [Actinomycetaceae bacterium]